MKKHLPWILLLFLFSLWSLRSIFHPEFMYTHDGLWHVERLINMTSLLPDQFPVRWSPTLDHGFGIPLFNFTYPAPYYLGSLFMFLGLGPVKAFYSLLFIGYFLGGLGVYLLGKKRPLIGFFGALFYLLTPYQFLDIFVRGALGEVIALGIIPWVILAISDLSQTGKFKWYTSLPLALLILSHNFYAYLFLSLISFFTIFIYRHKLLIFLSLLYSMILSAFFLVPAFFEKSYLLVVQEQIMSYSAHFVHPLQLIYSKWIYLGSVIGASPNEMSFQLGAANIILALSALGFLIYRLVQRRLAAVLLHYLFALAVAIFMMLPQSAWFWENLPLIASIQFPWRFLGVSVILFVLLYFELASFVVGKKSLHYFLIFSGVLVVLAFYNTRNYYRPVKWLNDAEFTKLHYEYAGQTTTAHRNELVPRWAAKERWQPDGGSLHLEGGAEIIEQQETESSLTFRANAANSSAHAIYYKNYFPTWVGYVDKEKLELTPTTTGEITFSLLPGEHHYELKVVQTPIEKFSNYLTLLSLAFLPLLAYITRSPRPKRESIRAKTS